MTTFRTPCGWNTAREPGKRPPLDYVLKVHQNSCETTRKYWLKIHWATPPWLGQSLLQRMKDIYATANSTWQHVDHIVPLKHPLVCGLHVPWNLQILPICENFAKSNYWWPDCPDHLCPIKNGTLDLVGDFEPQQLELGV